MDLKNAPHYTYTVPSGYEGTVSDLLHKKYNYSSRVIAGIKKYGLLLLSAKPALFTAKCRAPDRIDVYLPQEYPDCEPYDIPVDVLYEDEDVIVINKQPGLVVHPTKSHREKTLSGAVYAHWEKTGHTGKIRFVSRLDMDTSGVVLCAKNKYAHHFLQSGFQRSAGEKIYIAIAENRPEPLSGVIDAPIKREEEYSIFRVVDGAGEAAKTEYKTLAVYPGYSLIRLKLWTGRTHQIRVHLKYIGCTIAADKLYGGNESLINRQALHALSVRFTHPRTRREMALRAPLPQDMTEMIERLGGNTDEANTQ